MPPSATFTTICVRTNRVRVIVETFATNAAATVAEGAAKPESTLQFDEVDEAVRKIPTFLPVSDEMLSDQPALQGYLNSRLSLFVQQEEDQLLNGDGSGVKAGLGEGWTQLPGLAREEKAIVAWEDDSIALAAPRRR